MKNIENDVPHSSEQPHTKKNASLLNLETLMLGNFDTVSLTYWSKQNLCCFP